MGVVGAPCVAHRVWPTPTVPSGDPPLRTSTSADSLPAVGQGALGIECRADRQDLVELLRPLHDAETAACVLAERAMSRALAGSCQVPLGGFAEVSGKQLRMRGFVASPDGKRLIRAEQTGSTDKPEDVGNAVADALRAQGADEILALLNG